MAKFAFFRVLGRIPKRQFAMFKRLCQCEAKTGSQPWISLFGGMQRCLAGQWHRFSPKPDHGWSLSRYRSGIRGRVAGSQSFLARKASETYRVLTPIHRSPPHPPLDGPVCRLPIAAYLALSYSGQRGSDDRSAAVELASQLMHLHRVPTVRRDGIRSSQPA